jgi:DNA polymerase II small subunit/DNA polymerase delta subunit B
MQKYINSIQGGTKPNIICAGHLHSSYYLPYRNIHAIGSGCFQWQTNWMRSKGMQAVVGGWIVEVKHNKGEVISIKPQFTQFYK